MNRYDYKELRAAALKPSATFEDKDKLYHWLLEYDTSWNGESFDIDEGMRIYPIYQEIEEDVFDIVDYGIRYN